MEIRLYQYGLQFALGAALFGCTHDPYRQPAEANTPGAAVLAEDQDSTPNNFSLTSLRVNWSAEESSNQNVAGIYSNADTATVPQLIRKARTELKIEIYEMDDPEVFNAIRDVMDNYSVRVSVVQEPKPIGQRCDIWGKGLADRKSKKGENARANSPKETAACLAKQKLVHDVIAHGGSYVAFNKQNLCGQFQKKANCYEHGKMLIVDDRFALISTGNFNSTNLCDLTASPEVCNRDYSYITRDPVVIHALSDIFDRDLSGQRYDLQSIASRRDLQPKITVSPFSFEPLKAFLYSSLRAKPEGAWIQIQNQEFVENSGMADILIDLAKQGVEIDLQIADVCSHGHVGEKQAYDLYQMYAAMEDSGVKIRMFNKNHKLKDRPGYLHAKAMIVNGEKAWVGSTNFTSGSINENREFGIFFSHSERVEALSEILRADFEDASNQTWRDSLKCHYLGYQSPQALTSESEPPN